MALLVSWNKQQKYSFHSLSLNPESVLISGHSNLSSISRGYTGTAEMSSEDSGNIFFRSKLLRTTWTGRCSVHSLHRSNFRFVQIMVQFFKAIDDEQESVWLECDLCNRGRWVKSVSKNQLNKAGHRQLLQFPAAEVENIGEPLLVESALCPGQYQLDEEHCLPNPLNSSNFLFPIFLGKKRNSKLSHSFWVSSFSKWS